jgi:hypothetical protein
MMCTVIDANASDDAPRTSDESGVLVNLPRTRPQRSSARRVAARRAAGSANGDRTTRRGNGPGANASGANAPRKTPRKPAGTSAGESRAAAAAKASRSGAAGAKRRPRTPSKQAPALEEAAPRQGFECDGESASGSVAPPGGTELVATAVEIVGELAKAGLSTGERVVKDLLSRLPLS